MSLVWLISLSACQKALHDERCMLWNALLRWLIEFKDFKLFKFVIGIGKCLLFKINLLLKRYYKIPRIISAVLCLVLVQQSCLPEVHGRTQDLPFCQAPSKQFQNF